MFSSNAVVCSLLAQAAGEAAAKGDSGATMRMIGMIAVIAVIWILLMWLPQRKEQQRSKAMLDGLKKNDRVLLTSGIVGVVMTAQPEDKVIVVRIDETSGAKIRVLRSAVMRVLADEAEA